MTSLLTDMCVRAQTSALGMAIGLEPVEITNILNPEKDQQPQLSHVDFQAAEASFKQPTAAEVSVLTFWKLRYARSREQELTNEFARLLNRGSSLE